MATVLLDHLRAVFTVSAATALAHTLHETEAATQKAISGLLPTLTVGVLNRATNEDRVAGLYHVLIATPFGNELTATQLTEMGARQQQVVRSGNAMLKRLYGYGNRVQELVKSTAQYSAIRIDSANVLIGLIMFALMQFLHTQITSHDLTERQLAKLLADETDSVYGAVPSALSGTFGGPVSVGQPVATVPPPHIRRVGSFPWSRWLLVGSGLLLLCFLLFRTRYRKPGRPASLESARLRNSRPLNATRPSLFWTD